MLFRITYYILVCVFSCALGSCTKKLEQLYNDPDQLADARLEKIYTELLNNTRARPSYWHYRTFVAMHTGIYSQTLGFINTTEVYQQNASYIQDRWSDFYRPDVNGTGTVALFREMVKLYNNLPVEDQPNAEIFIRTAEVFLYDQATQMVDLWGDVPFREAGSLNAAGDPVMASFDDALSIYQEAISRLAILNSFFATYTSTPGTNDAFSMQDILMNGNVHKWRRYCNSLRLRLLMRISYVEEPYARQEVLEMLSNEQAYPLLSKEAMYNPAVEDILLEPLADYALNLREALTELVNYSAPDFMLNTCMLPANDPRIPVFFDKYGKIENGVFIENANYKAMPVTWSQQQQQLNLGNYAVLDSATFLYNSKLPGILISSAEVNFLKAEAFLRWGGADAAESYELAIRQSIHFYFEMNKRNTVFKTPVPPPGERQITAFLQSPTIALTGTTQQQLEKIGTQNWLNFTFLQANQAWAEIRRTGYPTLAFRTSGSPVAPLPPNRLLYPGNEVTYNSEYENVRHKDKPTYPIFWQKH